MYTERAAQTAAVSRGTSHVTTKERCKYTTSVDIQKRAMKSYSHSLRITHGKERSESVQERRIAIKTMFLVFVLVALRPGTSGNQFECVSRQEQSKLPVLGACTHCSSLRLIRTLSPPLPPPQHPRPSLPPRPFSTRKVP